MARADTAPAALNTAATTRAVVTVRRREDGDDACQVGSSRAGILHSAATSSPTRVGSSLNMLGRYSFQLPDLSGGLRPLRDPDAVDE